MKKYLFLFLWLVSLSAAAEIKYVFYFIGDGMGANQVLATEMYLAELEGTIGRKQLCMTTFPFSGQLSTYSDSNGITDSAAAGTCLASGKKTTNGRLGTDPKGAWVESIATILKRLGWGVGVMTSVSIDHATPGAFYAHVDGRGETYTIGKQLTESGFDFFAGSSFVTPDNEKQDENLYMLAEKQGYSIAHGLEEGHQLLEKEKMILIPEKEGLDIHQPGRHKIGYAIDAQENDMRLPEMTSLAIDFLSAHHDRFFLMVEGGAIDWACHGNDGATAIVDILDFDESIKAAYAFYLQHPDETLIVVTADHETGGMALGNSDYTLNLQLLQHQTCSSDMLTDGFRALLDKSGSKTTWAQAQAYLQSRLGFYESVTLSAEDDAKLQEVFRQVLRNKSKSTKTLYKEVDALSTVALKILNRKAKLGWTTGSHSASAVPLFAVGRGAEVFTGWHDNSQVVPLILQILAL